MITVATSIALFNIEKQKITVKSWKDFGFNVISVNIEEEIAILGNEFPEVKFVVAQRDSRKINGKPLVYIMDLLSALAATDSTVCGIVNADILIRVANKENFTTFISREAVGSFLFGSRINIADEQQYSGHEYSEGFDFFFFERQNTQIFENFDFCLGAPWWDYWLPLVPLLNDCNVKRLISPVAFHVVHEERWSQSSWQYYGNQLNLYLNEFFKKSAVTNQLNSLIDLRKKTAFIWILLRYGTDVVSFNDTHEDIETINISRIQYVDMQKELDFFRRKKHLKNSRIKAAFSRLLNFVKYNLKKNSE